MLWVDTDYDIKMWQYKCVYDKEYFNVLLEVSIMDIIYENGSFFSCCKIVTRLL